MNETDENQLLTPEPDTNLENINGATLELKLFMVSHGALWFQATGLERGVVGIHCAFTAQIDCPTIMHEVRIVETDKNEIANILETLPREQVKHLKYCQLFKIYCREGVYSVWCHGIGIYWEENPIVFCSSRMDEIIRSLADRPLWHESEKANYL
jgi:hypothetical protein